MPPITRDATTARRHLTRSARRRLGAAKRLARRLWRRSANHELRATGDVAPHAPRMTGWHIH